MPPVREVQIFQKRISFNHGRLRRPTCVVQKLCLTPAVGVCRHQFTNRDQELINDAPQVCINSLKLVCASQTPPWGINLEGVMQPAPEVFAQATPETRANFALTLIAILCGLGVLVFVCMATSGLDMSAGFF